MEQSEISPRLVVGAIIVVSGLAVSFLLWLLYVHHASADFAGRWMFLPALNALLNGLSAIALCVGLYFIKHHNKEAHRASMLLAFAFSSVFLISYIVNHALHGDTIFPGHGQVRTLYLSIFASHVILSIFALPIPRRWRWSFEARTRARWMRCGPSLTCKKISRLSSRRSGASSRFQAKHNRNRSFCCARTLAAPSAIVQRARSPSAARIPPTSRSWSETAFPAPRSPHRYLFSSNFSSNRFEPAVCPSGNRLSCGTPASAS